MDPMVSARVPAELREQVNKGLKEIGSSPTELINRAYEFFMDTKTLPTTAQKLSSGKRKLSKAKKKELVASINKTTFAVPESYFANRSYDQILREKLRESYEAIS